MIRAIISALLMSILLVGSVLAVEPHEVLKNPALEARARALSKDIRCLVMCLNYTYMTLAKMQF